MDSDAPAARWRRLALWAVPGILLAALGWSFVPRPAPPAGHRHLGRPDLSAQPSRDAAPADQTTVPGAQGALPIGPDGRPAHDDPNVSGDDATTPPAAVGASQPEVGASGEMRTGTLVGTDEAGRRQWQITADDVVMAQGRQVVILRNVRAMFYSPDGTTMSVTGGRGWYNTRTRAVDIRGDVHGVASNGRQIYVDALHYSPATRRVTGTGHVRVIEARVIMYADNLVSSMTLGQTKFFGHVHMTVR